MNAFFISSNKYYVRGCFKTQNKNELE